MGSEPGPRSPRADLPSYWGPWRGTAPSSRLVIPFGDNIERQAAFGSALPRRFAPNRSAVRRARASQCVPSSRFPPS